MSRSSQEPGRRWHGLVHALGSAACFAAVLGALVWMDPRVGERLSQAAGDSSSDWVTRLRASAEIVLQAARDQSLEHAPLLIFTLVAAVLVLFMIRT